MRSDGGTPDDGVIRVGDLVMVVRGHHCFMAEKGGIPFVVMDLVHQTGGGWHCPRCGERDIAQADLLAARAGWSKNPRSGIPLSWLKKINPPGVTEDEKYDEPIKEPA